MKQEFVNKWKDQQSFIRLLIFTFVGATIQFLVSVPFVWDFLTLPIDTIKETSNSLPPLLDNPLFVGIYFGITLIYSIGTSLSFRKKRIVSPINIQMITLGLFILLMPLALIQIHKINVTFEQILIFGSYFFMIAIGFGLAQTVIVRFMIGLNGSKEDTYQDTFRINTTYEIVKQKLQSRSFRDLFYFEIPIKYRARKNIFVLKSKMDVSEKIIIILGKDAEKKDSCLLSIISYESRYYQIQKTTRVKQKHDVAIAEIQKQIKTIDENILLKPEGLDNDISDFASDMALGITNNKLEYLKELSGFNKATLIGLGILFVVISYLRYIDQLTHDSYITISIFIGIAVVIDILPRFTRTNTELDY